MMKKNRFECFQIDIALKLNYSFQNPVQFVLNSLFFLQETEKPSHQCVFCVCVCVVCLVLAYLFLTHFNISIEKT